MHFAPKLSKYSTLALAAFAAIIAISPGPAHGSPACGELFETRHEGLLYNRAARAAMLLKLRAILPPGRHQVTVSGTADGSANKQTLAVSYSSLGEIQLMLNSQALVTSASTPTLKGANGNQSGVEGRIQLLANNKLVISNTQIYGDRSKVAGFTTREVAVEFTLSVSGGHIMNLKESTTNESQYRPTETFITRSELRREGPVTDPYGNLSH